MNERSLWLALMRSPTLPTLAVLMFSPDKLEVLRCEGSKDGTSNERGALSFGGVSENFFFFRFNRRALAGNKFPLNDRGPEGPLGALQLQQAHTCCRDTKYTFYCFPASSCSVFWANPLIWLQRIRWWGEICLCSFWLCLLWKEIHLIKLIISKVLKSHLLSFFRPCTFLVCFN